MRAALLVTTDEALTALVLRELTSCSVFTTHEVNEALRVLRVTEPDLVLVDVLPGTRESDQIIDAVRQFSSPAVVVCVYPANGLTPEQRDVVKKGDFLIQKPFTSH